MRTFACTIVLAAMMIPAVAWAQQEPGPNKGSDGNPSAPGVQPGGDPAKAKAELQRKQMELELQVRRDDIQLQQERHELEMKKQRAELDRWRRQGDDRRDGPKGLLVLMLIGCLVSHILLTVWVWTDMRAKGIGRALWVPIVLLTGLGGAILYAIVRVADTRDQAAPAAKAK
jgi:hypothetical protein